MPCLLFPAIYVKVKLQTFQFSENLIFFPESRQWIGIISFVLKNVGNHGKCRNIAVEKYSGIQLTNKRLFCIMTQQLKWPALCMPTSKLSFAAKCSAASADIFFVRPSSKVVPRVVVSYRIIWPRLVLFLPQEKTQYPQYY